MKKIKLFIGNVWMILAVDPLHKIIFSFWCAVFSLFVAEAMRIGFSRVLIDLEGIKYIDKSNMIEVCTSPLTVLLILLFLIIMINTALFEIGVLFSINIYVLREKSFLRSCKGAWILGKRRYLNTVICILLLSLVVN